MNGGKPAPVRLPEQTFTRLGEGKYSEAVVPQDDPSIVLKFLRSEWRRSDDEGVHPRNHFRHTNSALQILKEGLPHNLPRTELTSLTVRGAEQVIIVQERIQGEDLDHAKPSEELKAALLNVLDGAVELHLKHLTKRNAARYHHSVTLDLKGENFIWGRPWADPSQPLRLYLVDSYPVEACEWVEFISQDIPSRKQRFLPEYAPLFDQMKTNVRAGIRNAIPHEEFKAGC